MNKIIIKIINWYLKRIVRQGLNHKQNIIDFYKLVAVAARNEFTEDNIPTLNRFLFHCHRESLQKTFNSLVADKPTVMMERAARSMCLSLGEDEAHWNDYIPEVIAVFTVLMNPCDEMIMAGGEEFSEWKVKFDANDRRCGQLIYMAFLREALNENT